jgi:hypothetical protein
LRDGTRVLLVEHLLALRLLLGQLRVVGVERLALALGAVASRLDRLRGDLLRGGDRGRRRVLVGAHQAPREVARRGLRVDRVGDALVLHELLGVGLGLRLRALQILVLLRLRLPLVGRGQVGRGLVLGRALRLRDRLLVGGVARGEALRGGRVLLVRVLRGERLHLRFTAGGTRDVEKI